MQALIKTREIPVTDKTESDTWTCQECGHFNTPDQRTFCGRCGILQVATKETARDL